MFELQLREARVVMLACLLWSGNYSEPVVVVTGTCDTSERELVPRTLRGPTHPGIDSHDASILFSTLGPGFDLALPHTLGTSRDALAPHSDYIIQTNHTYNYNTIFSPTPLLHLLLSLFSHTNVHTHVQTNHAKRHHMGVLAHRAPKQDTARRPVAVARPVLHMVRGDAYPGGHSAGRGAKRGEMGG
jgi:hypothetical protein